MATIYKKINNSFKWFNTTQFLGALNDNIFKLLVIFFLIGSQGDRAAAKVTSLASAIFVIPFLIFMAYAGKLADKYSKSRIVVLAKFAEILIMTAAFAAFTLNIGIGLYCVLFLMAAQSAFFGPAKYGILPEIVPHEKLSKANGQLEALTYLAIVIGTAIGPFISQITGENFAMASIACIVIACAGFVTSLQIKKTPAAGTDQRSSIFFGKDIWHTLQEISRDKELLLAVGASAYFLLIGGFVQLNLIPYGMSHLGLSKTESAYLFVIAAIGIGVGSTWAGRISGRDVEFGIVPLGAIGLTISSIGLSLVPHFYILIALVFIMGVSSGLFIVPIQTFIQLRSPADKRGRILAASGFLGWTSVLLASGLILLLNSVWKLSASQMFMVLGVITLVPALVTLSMLPDFLTRFIAVMLTRFCYKIKIVGLENLPVTGPGLLVSNHVSYVDAFLLLATSQRRIRFVIEKKFYKKWWIRPFVNLMRVIPISSSDPPRQLVESLRLARQALDNGYLVCIFAEGMMTRSGMMAGFKAGFERIMKDSTAPIIPVYLGGVWGSIFSYYGGRVLSMLPKDFPYPLTIHFGKHLDSHSSASIVRQKVAELSCDYFNGMKSPKRSLSYQFIKAARKNWRKKAIADSTGKFLTFGKTLIGALILGEKIKQLTARDEKIGVLLPASAAGAIANLAITLTSRIGVNLNFTAGQENMNYAIKQCNIKQIISARKFAEKVQMNFESENIIYLEDIIETVTKKEKIKAYLKARFLPIAFLTEKMTFGGDELATIIFSSGSSGKPKGVMLSHHNIISNIEGVRMVVAIRRGDDLCGALPIFHSFGYTCGIWMPLVSGVPVSYIANPLDGAAVAKSVRENRSTIMFAPPTFLTTYIRRAERDDFKSLRIVAGGAEKLKPRIIDAFHQKFGIRPVEGFGATELSPVVSLNIPDVAVNEVRQIGTKEGSVGHPLPGIAAKIVNIETDEPLTNENAQGLLMVKGPNIMLGYLNDSQRTEQVIKDGWYNTGDIAKIDNDGFIRITDRLSRFSKIAGEMVPHGTIEQVLNDALAATEPVVAVTAVEDEKRGEELIVFFVQSAGPAEKLYDIIAKSNLPNIAKPRKENFIEIDAMPTLGSGKINFGKLKEIAAIKKKL
ncbi:MAG: 2-acyl-glycerophospho-ethanolamine acyltransferase [Planctomycetes bacterium GWF2_42_9]|nr:MAG: 2-acyl-glycerophospho-ethanolamine acyltransferase [Planctomycetes bacterium GWF2_42_9]HAL45185.1 acyl-[ACP]--phospholipid O-acyltransferase [Phycisphaerales bacterium]